MILSLEAAIAVGDDYRELSKLSNVKVDLRYASKNNFMKENVYGNGRKAYLHREAFTKLEKASELLKKEHPDLSFLVYDALRPRAAQWKLWNFVKGTDQQMYVADPNKGSIHNYGFALDIGLADKAGRELDMGAGYDDFREISQPQAEEKFLKSGELKAKQVENRKILRSVMERAGFIQLKHEWWHYDAKPGADVRAQYQIVENW